MTLEKMEIEIEKDMEKGSRERDLTSFVTGYLAAMKLTSTPKSYEFTKKIVIKAWRKKAEEINV